ncbi:MAG: sugar ABC transporter substrate-binding protein [bacterium]
MQTCNNIFQEITRFGRIIGILTLVIYLIGCDAKKETDKIVLRVAYWGHLEERKTKLQMIDAFQNQHPNIKIKPEPTEYPYYDKLLTMIAGKNAPDVFLVNSNSMFPDLARKGAMVDLTSFIQNDQSLPMPDIFPQTMAAFKIDGKMYGLPNQFNTQVLYYNTRIFDEMKVPYPTASWTWDDLKTNAIKLTKRDADGRLIHAGIAFDMLPWDVIILINQNGGAVFNEPGTKCLLDSPEAIEAIQYLTNLRNKYRVIPTDAEYQSLTGMNMFQLERSAMYVTGQWTIAELVSRYPQVKWSVVPLPRQKKAATMMDVHGFAIASQSKYPKEAWEFVKFMISPEQQKLITRLRINLPISKTVVDEYLKTEQDQRLKTNMQVGVDSLKSASFFPTTAKCGVDYISSMMWEDIEGCYATSSKKSVKQAMQNITKRINKQLQSE